MFQSWEGTRSKAELEHHQQNRWHPPTHPALRRDSHVRTPHSRGCQCHPESLDQEPDTCSPAFTRAADGRKVPSPQRSLCAAACPLQVPTLSLTLGLGWDTCWNAPPPPPTVLPPHPPIWLCQGFSHRFSHCFTEQGSPHVYSVNSVS